MLSRLWLPVTFVLVLLFVVKADNVDLCNNSITREPAAASLCSTVYNQETRSLEQLFTTRGFLEAELVRDGIHLDRSLFSDLDQPGWTAWLNSSGLRSMLKKESYSLQDIENLTSVLVKRSIANRYPGLLSRFSQATEREYYELYSRLMVKKGITETFADLGIIKPNSYREQWQSFFKSHTQKFFFLISAVIDTVSVVTGHLPPLAMVFKRRLSITEKERFIALAEEVGFEQAFDSTVKAQLALPRTKVVSAYNWLAKTYSVVMSLALISAVHQVHLAQKLQEQQTGSAIVASLAEEARPKTPEENADLMIQNYVDSARQEGRIVDPHSPALQEMRAQLIAHFQATQPK